MILREVSDRGFVPPGDFTGVDEGTVIAARFPQLGFGRGRRVRQQGVQQSRLPCSVPSHKRYLFPAGDTGREIANDLVVAVSFSEVLDFKDVLARRALLLEFDIWALNVRLGQFRYLQAFDFLAA